MNTNISYWEHDSFLKSYDFLIIGAGIVGLSAAYFLKKKNPTARIAVLEKGFLPSGASTKNAGFACIGSPTELIADSKNESVTELIERIKWRWHGLNLLRETIGDSNLDFENCGGFELYNSEKDRQESLDRLNEINSWMFEATGETDVFKSTVVNNYPSIVSRLEGSVHTGKMMQSWVRLNQEVGNFIWFNTEVSALEEGAVYLKNGYKLNTKTILVATNGFASTLLPVTVKPARGVVFVTQPIPNLPWKGVFHYDEGFVYFRNIGNRLLFGGGRNKSINDEETTEFGINPIIQNYLFSLSENLLGINLKEQVEFSWTGIMGFSETKSPILKEIKPGIHVRVGLGGMGVAIGSEIGHAFAAKFG